MFVGKVYKYYIPIAENEICLVQMDEYLKQEHSHDHVMINACPYQLYLHDPKREYEVDVLVSNDNACMFFL